MSRRGGPWRLADGVRPVAMGRRRDTNTSSGQTVTDDRMVRRVVGAYLGAVLVAAAIALRWAIVPPRGATDTVRKLAAGQFAARAAPGGPTEVRDLSLSVNILADENDRPRAKQEENVRLSTVVRETAKSVREHLDAEGVTREAVTAIAQNLTCDYVWVSLVDGTGLTLPVGNRDDWGLRRAVVDSIPPEYIEMAKDLYHQRASFCLEGLDSDGAELVPERIRNLLLGLGGQSLLFTPFGTGRDLLGELTLLRSRPGMPWTPAEIGAVESVAAEVGRGLDHARLYEQEKDLVEKLKDLDLAKSDFSRLSPTTSGYR